MTTDELNILQYRVFDYDSEKGDWCYQCDITEPGKVQPKIPEELEDGKSLSELAKSLVETLTDGRGSEFDLLAFDFFASSHPTGVQRYKDKWMEVERISTDKISELHSHVNDLLKSIE